MINSVARCAALGAVLGVLFTLVMLLGHQTGFDHAAVRPHAAATTPVTASPDGDDQWI
jgi:hypothetical protein